MPDRRPDSQVTVTSALPTYTLWADDDTKPVLTFHSLRHSYGTALAMGGIKAIQIKHLMGHSSLSMTDKYMHFAPDLDEAERIGRVFAALREAV
jgi:integrase